MILSEKEKDELLGQISTRLSYIGTLRSVSWGKQYKLLLARFLTHVSRDPLALFAVGIMSIMQAILQGSVFWQIGQSQFTLTDMVYNVNITGNFLGLAFLVCSDQFICMSFG